LSPPRHTHFPYTTLFRSPNRSRTELPKLFAAKKYPKANTRAYITIVITLEIQSFLFACFAADGFLSKVMKKLLKLLLTSLIFSTASFGAARSEEHTSELQSRFDLVCRLLLEKKNNLLYYIF